MNGRVWFGTTLRVLNLVDVTIVDADNRHEDEVDLWSPLLRDMAAHLDLEKFCISKPSMAYSLQLVPGSEDFHLHYPAFIQSVYFSAAKDGSEKQVHYSGDDAKAALEQLADSLSIPWSWLAR
ncbi:hypothetical protein GE09DRAFT_1224488 [Coniochaeta sp. 2T2.1]|nr:hypothetical protein GE09DRAFT_1224488 [Coniochaeta sp. 2T2.1]